MKYHYSASDFGSDEVVVGNNFISTYTSKEDFLKLKQDVDVFVNELQTEINGTEAMLEKLQKELQEFKKATNEFQRHLIGTSITLSIAIVFILILISFYYK
jgi:hypothetical protein